jgi:uncharacterized FlaG/YvyC family protein
MNLASVNNASAPGPGGLSTHQTLSQEQRTLIRAMKAVNTSGLLGEDHELTYSIDRVAHVVVARLIDKVTGNVLQQLPAEYVLRMAEELNRG